MKKLVLSASLFVLLSGLTVNSYAQGQEKGKQKKEQPPAKENKGRNDVIKANDQGQGKGQGKNQGQGQDKKEFKDEKNNPGKKDDHSTIDKRQGKENVNKIIASHGNGKIYEWDRETFRDRKKIRNDGKVTVCHKFNHANEPAVSITVSQNALKAHLGHGDVVGTCPPYSGSFSDIFIGRRRDYYDVLYGAQDQVIYSQSILDYALHRLTGARSDLVVLQNSNAPVYVIERRQAVVTELEENVSLLEIALTAVAGVLVAKLLN